MLSHVELELAIEPGIRPTAFHLPKNSACHGQAQGSTYKRASDEESWGAEKEGHRYSQDHSGPPTNTDRSPHFIRSETAHDGGLPIEVVGKKIERSILQVSGFSHVAYQLENAGSFGDHEDANAD